MRPQFFPWLFDDRNAWEKSLVDPRYSYELPMDGFMALYQIERNVNGDNAVALPTFSPPMMPLPAAAPIPLQTYAPTTPFIDMSLAAASAPAPAMSGPKQEEGILSQDEIDALLSGL